MLPVAIIRMDDAKVTQNMAQKKKVEPIKKVQKLTMLCLIMNKMSTMKYYRVIKTRKADIKVWNVMIWK